MERMLWAENAASLHKTSQDGVFLRLHPDTHDLLLGPTVTSVFFFANVDPFQAVRKSSARCAPPHHQERLPQGDGQPRLISETDGKRNSGPTA